MKNPKLNNQEYAYISIKEGGQVIIKNDDEGIVIDIYVEGADEPFNSMWFFHDELQRIITHEKP